MKSKKHAEWASRIMLEKILVGVDLEDTMSAFKWRMEEGTKWNKI